MPCRNDKFSQCEPQTVRQFREDFESIDIFLEEVFSVLAHTDYTVNSCMPACPDYQNYGSKLLPSLLHFWCTGKVHNCSFSAGTTCSSTARPMPDQPLADHAALYTVARIESIIAAVPPSRVCQDRTDEFCGPCLDEI